VFELRVVDQSPAQLQVFCPEKIVIFIKMQTNIAKIVAFLLRIVFEV